MLHLFQSIFGISETEAAAYPESIVEMAIERAAEGTDSRLTALPGYHKKLRPAVLKAIDHVIAVVDRLPASVELSRENYSSDPRLSAFFASVDHMRQVIRGDVALSDCLADATGSGADQIEAVLVTHRMERKVLGMELEGETVRREVAQVAVNFTHHRLVDPTTSREETDKLLRRRVFDNLLEIALARISSAREERAGLERQRGLLQRKQEALESSGWGFKAQATAANSDVNALESQIEEIEQQLHGMGVDSGILGAHFDILADVLEHAKEQVWYTPVSLVLDRMGIKRDAATPNSIELELQELRSVRDVSVIPLRVTIPRREFPERGDFLAEAQRLLG